MGWAQSFFGLVRNIDPLPAFVFALSSLVWDWALLKSARIRTFLVSCKGLSGPKVYCFLRTDGIFFSSVELFTGFQWDWESRWSLDCSRYLFQFLKRGQSRIGSVGRTHTRDVV